MINLISNAIKYSEEQTEIELFSANKGECIFLKVRDHGIGIPQEEQKNLYNKFFRARNTSNIQGTGLGLSLSYDIVSAQGGEIIV